MRQHIVAPYTGAWIEIITNANYSPTCASLPTRERGLKFPDALYAARESLSLPTQERGLKWNLIEWNTLHLLVAPYTGAWIEILEDIYYKQRNGSLPTRERGLK